MSAEIRFVFAQTGEPISVWNDDQELCQTLLRRSYRYAHLLEEEEAGPQDPTVVVVRAASMAVCRALAEFIRLTLSYADDYRESWAEEDERSVAQAAWVRAAKKNRLYGPLLTLTEELSMPYEYFTIRQEPQSADASSFLGGSDRQRRRGSRGSRSRGK